MRKQVWILNGPPRSGKDTITDAAVAEINMSTRLWADKDKFAAPIKAAVAAFIGLTAEEAKHFFETEAKDVPHERFFDTTPRSMLISFSEDWVKPNYGKGAFGEILGHKLNRVSDDVVIISDGGFEEERVALAQVAKEAVVRVARLQREGKTYDGDSRGYLANPDIIIRQEEGKPSAARDVLLQAIEKAINDEQ